MIQIALLILFFFAFTFLHHHRVGPVKITLQLGRRSTFCCVVLLPFFSVYDQTRSIVVVPFPLYSVHHQKEASLACQYSSIKAPLLLQ